ncbi:MAG: diadenylate cyclase CdaA [Candidatus Omnitrophica bacterium]|nr:diadenylate cyclase CdaA [Candidatus Omnitrophota bacterium]
MNTLVRIAELSWRPVLEIAVLWFILYHILLLFAGTRARQVFRGILILVFLFLLSQAAGLPTVGWLLNKLFAISVIAALIIFHPEIRQGFVRLGQQHFFATSMKEEEIDLMLTQISKATDNLCKTRVGALIAIENKDSLSAYAENGVRLDARVSPELIETVFTPNSILHDGGLVIQDGRITAAGCIFPLTDNQDLSRMFGTRHRAALGLSEQTDAVIIVVSEERHDTSVVYQERLYRDLGKEELFQKIKEFLKSTLNR